MALISATVSGSEPGKIVLSDLNDLEEAPEFLPEFELHLSHASLIRGSQDVLLVARVKNLASNEDEENEASDASTAASSKKSEGGFDELILGRLNAQNLNLPLTLSVEEDLEFVLRSVDGLPVQEDVKVAVVGCLHEQNPETDDDDEDSSSDEDSSDEEADGETSKKSKKGASRSDSSNSDSEGEEFDAEAMKEYFVEENSDSSSDEGDTAKTVVDHPQVKDVTTTEKDSDAEADSATPEGSNDSDSNDSDSNDSGSDDSGPNDSGSDSDSDADAKLLAEMSDDDEAALSEQDSDDSSDDEETSHVAPVKDVSSKKRQAPETAIAPQAKKNRASKQEIHSKPQEKKDKQSEEVKPSAVKQQKSEAPSAATAKVKEQNKSSDGKKKGETVAPGIVRHLAGGLKYEILQTGSGTKMATTGKKVFVKYEGRLAKTGKKFDSGEISFTVGGKDTVAGFDMGVRNALVKESRRVFIPAKLGYGKQRVGPIPPNSDLIFDITIKAIQ